jgi:hypothetical protein
MREIGIEESGAGSIFPVVEGHKETGEGKKPMLYPLNIKNEKRIHRDAQ